MFAATNTSSTEQQSRGGRAEATRKRLIVAGRSAFARKPPSLVHLKNDILLPAGVSVGSFYHQFEDKSGLLLAILEHDSRELRRKFKELHTPERNRTPEEIAYASYAMAFDIADAFPDLFRIQLLGADDLDPRIAHFLERDRAAWQRSRAADYAHIARSYDIRLDVEFVSELIGMLTYGTLRRYLWTPKEKRAALRKRLLPGLVQLTLKGLPGLGEQPRTAAQRDDTK